MLEIKMQMDCSTEITMLPSAVAPFSFADISGKAGLKSIPRKMRMHSDSALIDGVRHEGLAEANFSIVFHESLDVYALVNGGWLPPPFVLKPYFLVDKNVVARMKRISEGEGREDFEAFRWWMSLFEQHSAIFNPICCAMEGNERRTPTFDEFKVGYEEGEASLRAFLPNTSVVHLDKASMEVAWRLQGEATKRLHAETQFLLETMPLLTEPCSKPRLRAVERRICDSAQKFDVRSGFAFIAALSCLYSGGRPLNPAAKILKPKKDYTESDAFNALADFNHLSLFLQAQRLPGIEGMALCTCDRALAQFWSGLCPRIEKDDHARGFMTVDVTADLFPRMSGLERVELAKRLLA